MSEGDSLSNNSRVGEIKSPAFDEKHIGDVQEKYDNLNHIVELTNDFGVKAISDQDLELIASHLDDKPFDEWLDILKKANEYHVGDEAIPESRRKFLCDLAEGPSGLQSEEDWQTLVKFEAFLIEEWSIYPEVRAATRPIEEEGDDDYENFRVYVLGILWACAGCTLDTFFYVRQPSVSISVGAVQLLIAGSGQLWARLPYLAIPLPRGHKFVINNGKPWSFKEQMLASLTMSVSLGSPYSQSAVLALANENFFNFPAAGGFGFTILLTLSTQCLGFGLAGIVRSFCVYPVKCVWFDVLPTLTLNRTLVKNDVRENINGWRLKRWEFFWLVAWLNFAWYWITNLVFTALSYFNWLTWISPDNIDLSAITGPFSGLGLNPITTFDTNVIGFSSIYTPFYIIIASIGGYAVSMLAIIVIWYTNVRWTGYMPINTNYLFDNTGKTFKVAKLLNDKLELDEEKYQAYSLPFWSAGNLVNYGTFFMFYPAMFVYTLLNYWSYITESIGAFWDGIKSSKSLLNRYNDRFSREMRKYKEVPEWWFISILLVSLALAIACVEHYRFTVTPVWTIFLALGLALVFLIPQNILRARTTTTFALNVLYELIIGYALPGNGIALMISKCFGTMIGSQTDNWVSNQAQSHYTGIAPRALYRCQLLSVICTSFVVSGLITWQASGALGPTFCTQDNISKFFCPGIRTYFNAGVQWGTIGPKRVFKGLYPTMKYCFLIGVFYPLPFWAARKWLPRLAPRYPEGTRMRKILECSWLYSFNEMIFLSSGFGWAPSNWYYNTGNWEAGIIWHKVIKQRYPRWWSKYTFVFYNATSVGNAFATLFAFFATSYRHIVEINWWGNDVYVETADANLGAIRMPMPASGYFGPEPGHYPTL